MLKHSHVVGKASKHQESAGRTGRYANEASSLLALKESRNPADTSSPLELLLSADSIVGTTPYQRSQAKVSACHCYLVL